ncbi:MAG: PDDEXK nuclease domain-containing protein [Burkholderiaceae bacterium]|jgi:predicted nuclease of restriction endonuclease-like (RecB) superfamily|nr:PDDEXK nuclease domain-containing protein [Burkholderiaceae bacterium]
MNKKKTAPAAAAAATPQQYASLLGDIKQRIRHAQARAWMAVNAEMIRLYWSIRQLIAGRQQHEGYGTAVIPRLARDLHNELPEEKGFSERNIKRMLAFYRLYPQAALDAELVPQPVAQVASPAQGPQPVALSAVALLLAVPWGHHALLMEKVKDAAARRWYMQATVENGWSRALLLEHIQAATHRRAGQAASNFALRLPAPDSALVHQTLKDPYLFDFLTLAEPFHERELETGLVAHLEKFLLELGQGFAFVGRQFRVAVDEQDFYVDLLFYHLKLRCYVVIELKRGPFKPEYAGKVNFYCNVVDEHLRHSDDKPTIGLILCQQQSRVLAEYTLRGMAKPIGVSSYELTRALPKELRSSLPSVEQLESELGAIEGERKEADE